MQNSDNYRSHCPINFLLETLGDKWTLLVVRDLMFKGKCTYNEFLQSDEKISTNILADRLKKLEENNVVTKVLSEQSRNKMVYRLTNKGADLLPLMLEITAWSAKHDDSTNVPANFLKEFTADKKALSALFLSQLSVSDANT